MAYAPAAERTGGGLEDALKQRFRRERAAGVRVMLLLGYAGIWMPAIYAIGSGPGKMLTPRAWPSFRAHFMALS